MICKQRRELKVGYLKDDEPGIMMEGDHESPCTNLKKCKNPVAGRMLGILMQHACITATFASYDAFGGKNSLLEAVRTGAVDTSFYSMTMTGNPIGQDYFWSFPIYSTRILAYSRREYPNSLASIKYNPFRLLSPRILCIVAISLLLYFAFTRLLKKIKQHSPLHSGVLEHLVSNIPNYAFVFVSTVYTTTGIIQALMVTSPKTYTSLGEVADDIYAGKIRILQGDDDAISSLLFLTSETTGGRRIREAMEKFPPLEANWTHECSIYEAAIADPNVIFFSLNTYKRCEKYYCDLQMHDLVESPIIWGGLMMAQNSSFRHYLYELSVFGILQAIMDRIAMEVNAEANKLRPMEHVCNGIPSDDSVEMVLAQSYCLWVFGVGISISVVCLVAEWIFHKLYYCSYVGV